MQARSGLERQIEAISQEIRDYPTPIARCDDQLTDLREQRARLVEQLKHSTEHAGGCTPLGTWTNDGGLHGA